MRYASLEHASVGEQGKKKQRQDYDKGQVKGRQGLAQTPRLFGKCHRYREGKGADGDLGGIFKVEAQMHILSSLLKTTMFMLLLTL
jgi:hypothetical protein